nr:50S ribosomal protein L11 methyltransferase [Mannheimia haemolytica]
MAWVQIRLNSTDKQAEEISDFLTEIGAVSVTFMDSQDTPIFEPLPGETRLWGNTDVVGLFDAETDMNLIVEALKPANWWTKTLLTKSSKSKTKTGNGSGWIISTQCSLANGYGSAQAGVKYQTRMQ